MDRGGARQPDRFDPARAHLLGGTERERWLPYARIRALLDVPSGATIVDFGAGTGTIAIPLAFDLPASPVVAVDEQPAMLERLRAAAGAAPPPNLSASGAEAVAPACASRILALNVLHEAGDAALARMSALLEPRGFALVIDWRSDVARDVGPPAAHTYTEDEAIRRLETAGFDVRAREEPAFPYHFVLEARPRSRSESAATPSRREASIARLRATAGVRISVTTSDGVFDGYVDAGSISASSVTVMIAAERGGDPSHAVCVDLESILQIR